MRRSYSVSSKETATGEQSPVNRLLRLAEVAPYLTDMNNKPAA
nr:MAG TPA: hypothetical protein [Caudoviricetes sp.]